MIDNLSIVKMNLTINEKLIADALSVLLLNTILFFFMNRNEWFMLEPDVFLAVSLLYILFCLLTFATGRFYSTINKDKKSIFIFVLGTMILKTVISIGLIVILFGWGKLTHKGEIFPILSIYLIYTYMVIKVLRAIDK